MDMYDLMNKRCGRLFEDLASGELTTKQFHSRKTYAKATKNYQMVVDLSTAWELWVMESKNEE